MEEDWGTEDWGVVANPRQTFSLFRRVSPQEEAKKNTFVDIIVYNQWTKAERRLYQKLKAEAIAEQVAREELESLDDITNSLDQLFIMKTGKDECDSKIDDLIGTLESMKLKASDTKVPMDGDKKVIKKNESDQW